MVSIILHTHLPWVLHHGTWPHGSDWLFEAMAECYLPLISACQRLVDDGIRPGITVSLSPVLCEQLAHPDTKKLFADYCRDHIALAKGDAQHMSSQNMSDDIIALTEYWADWYTSRLEEFERVNGDIVGAFRKLEEAGALETMTCGMTHGYLPLLAEDASVDRQIGMAVQSHIHHFGRHPRALWMPECAYRPAYSWRTLLPVPAYSVARPRRGIEQFLRRHGIEATVIDQGALQGARRLDGRAEPLSAYDLHLMGSTDHEETTTVFTRDLPMTLQVWSGQTGYPGDPDYLDFHKKYYRSALRYWRVTDVQGDMGAKQPYVAAWAQSKTEVHAEHFVNALAIRLRYRRSETTRPPLLCLPFDTELFGHWWFEGPMFLEHVIRRVHAHPELAMGTVSDCLGQIPPTTKIAVPESSWGKNGTDEVWMNPDTVWTWEREYGLERRMERLLEKHGHREHDTTMQRLISNAIRQLMLAQASDWQFLMTNFTAREYATMRFHSHASDCEKLCTLVEKYAISAKLTDEEEAYLDECERRDVA